MSDKEMLEGIEAAVNLLNSRMSKAIAEGIEFDIEIRNLTYSDGKQGVKVEVSNYHRTEWLDGLLA